MFFKHIVFYPPICPYGKALPWHGGKTVFIVDIFVKCGFN